MTKIITVLPPSRDHDWVSLSQINKYLPEFFAKVEEVRDNLQYSTYVRNMVQGINESLDIHEIISWKQYGAVVNCQKVPTGAYTSRRSSVGYVEGGMLGHLISHLNNKHWGHAFDEESLTIGD